MSDRFGWLWVIPIFGVLFILQACTTEPLAAPDPPDPTVQASGNQSVEFGDRVPVLPDSPFAYTDELPDHFAAGIPLDDDVVTLGRVLFYDVNLSVNRTVRCASCHSQADSFTDAQFLSLGVRGTTLRHSMSLANATYTPNDQFFWDLRVDSLEAQIEEAISSPTEMGLELPQVAQRVTERPFYADLLTVAYGDETATGERILDSLAQFVRSMVSYRSAYDEGRALVSASTDPFPNFDDQENEGRDLFFTDVNSGGGSCSSCHTGEAQIVAEPTNNGLSVDDLDQFGRVDAGRARATSIETDFGLFRAPSLRNVAVTEPFMHDGSIPTLNKVVEHYNSGIQPHRNLSPILRDTNSDAVRLGWTTQQVDAVVAFLETLTDEEFLNDPRFADPFR